jgi:ankyrin repeat protein
MSAIVLLGMQHPVLSIESIKNIEKYLIKYNPRRHTPVLLSKRKMLKGLIFLRDTGRLPTPGGGDMGEMNVALVYAASLGYMHIVSFLVDHGADIHVNNEMPLHVACYNMHMNVVTHILQDPNTDIDAKNGQALIIACEKGYLEMVEYLVKCGSNIRIDEESPLIGAATYGHLHIVQYLVRHGADIYASHGLVLFQAISNGFFDIVRFVFERDTIGFFNLDHALQEATMTGSLSMVRYFVEQGANIDADDGLAIKWAAYGCHLDSVQYLVEMGARVTFDNPDAAISSYYDGNTSVFVAALHGALHHQDNRVVEYMNNLK